MRVGIPNIVDERRRPKALVTSAVAPLGCVIGVVCRTYCLEHDDGSGHENGIGKPERIRNVHRSTSGVPYSRRSRMSCTRMRRRRPRGSASPASDPRLPEPHGHRRDRLSPDQPHRRHAPSSSSSRGGTSTSTILISNKGFEEWGENFGDEVMAAALIDRLAHHCHIVNIRGNSYRLRQHTELARRLQAGGAAAPPPERRPRPRSHAEVPVPR